MSGFPLKYVAPNAVTCTGMLVGLASIVFTLDQNYEQAAWMILLCVLIDKLDGSVARALNASSRFGVELDSFSDFLTFGVAPGFLFLGLLTNDPRYAPTWESSAGFWFVRCACAFFIVMAALRLAKFNVLTEEIGSKIFLGIPTTLTGALSCSYLLMVWKYDLPHAAVAYYPIVLIVLGLWMVSNVPLPKVRKTDSTGFNIFLIVNATAAYLLVPFQRLPEYLFILAALWAFVGSVYALATRDKESRVNA